MEVEQRDHMLAAILAIIAVAAVPFLLWDALSNYINPATATERKDVVNMFVLSVAGLVGSITALAAVGNLILSRRNLQQQRELDDRRAQDASGSLREAQQGPCRQGRRAHLRCRKPERERVPR